LVLISSISGYIIALQLVNNELTAYFGFLVGLILSLAAIRIEMVAKDAPTRVLLGAVIGLVTGLLVANLVTYPLVFQYFNNPQLEYTAYIIVNIIIGSLGLSVGIKKGEELHVEFKKNKNKVEGGNEKASHKNILILDTSVIIDGRIADICETGFIDGTLLVPKFVIGELQYIADSPDPIKKVRGARGLDALDRLQKDTPIDVEISDEDFPATEQVDLKLVELAKVREAKILTNDINLHKVARLHGVTALNINSLANAVKPVILPGEEIRILVAKEGKENNQGVGYLDDGTMVVIDNAANCVGKTISANVTSILQTSSGRMVFSRTSASGCIDIKKNKEPIFKAVD
jgi:uncharacterized protein YacL